MSEEVFRWIRSDGLTVTLPVAQSRRGLFLPPVTVSNIDDRYRRGGHISQLSVMSRVIEFRCVVTDSDPAVVRATLRELAEAFDDVPEGGRIQVDTMDDRQLELTRVTYSSGLEVDDKYHHFQPLVLQFIASDPDWYYPGETQFEWAFGGTPQSFLPFPTLSGNFVTISVSDLIRTETINNYGELPVWPIWEIVGECDHPIIERMDTGEQLELNISLTASQAVVVDTATGEVRDHAGLNRFSTLVRPVSFWQIPPGDSTIRVTLTDAEPGSKVVLRMRPKNRTI